MQVDEKGKGVIIFESLIECGAVVRQNCFFADPSIMLITCHIEYAASV